MELAIRISLSLVVGYLLGSLSPAYILGRILKGIDIRTMNLRNAGTRNVKATLGTWPAVITAAVDTLKGIAAVIVAQETFGLPAFLIAVPAAASVAGHIFPFYMRFRGGKGSATAIGIFLYLTVIEIAGERFNPITLGAILLVAALVFFASRSGDVTGLVVFPLMLVMTPLELGFTANSTLNMAVSAFLSGSIVDIAIRHGVFRPREGAAVQKTERKLWRLITRPFALLFIPIDLLWGRKILLLVLGAVSLVFILIDLIRLLGRWEISVLIKAKEARRFSSMTYFLLAVFIAFLAFPAEIPYLALCFTSMGDLFGKLIGSRFGRKKLHGSKTLEGALAFLAGSLAAGYTISLLVTVPLLFVGLGGVFAAVVELFSERLDDNFSVPLLSGGLLMALRYFLKI